MNYFTHKILNVNNDSDNRILCKEKSSGRSSNSSGASSLIFIDAAPAHIQRRSASLYYYGIISEIKREYQRRKMKNIRKVDRIKSF